MYVRIRTRMSHSHFPLLICMLPTLEDRGHTECAKFGRAAGVFELCVVSCFIREELKDAQRRIRMVDFPFASEVRQKSQTRRVFS